MNKTLKCNALGLAIVLSSVFPVAGQAHDSPNEGHIPKDATYGFAVIGRDTLAGIVDGNYTDVWSHKGFAYIGTFQDPCSSAGVFIVDMAAAVAQYPDTEGATVASIRSAPNTRINDVKVHTVGDRGVLITTQEACGMAIPGAAMSGGNAPFQVGQGGISLYDVTNPSKPKALKRNFLEFGGVHNTFARTWEGKSYLIGTADTFDFFDTFFVDITKPQSPKLLGVTGALDWIPQGVNLDRLETGSSAGIFNHDVWVEIIDGTPTAVVSYWDLGFVTLGVTDPSNPVFLGDSTYPDPEPIVGEPCEGNAHAAVFGGNRDYNNTGGDVDVPVGGADSGNTATIAQLGELGYYAPAPTVEESFIDEEGNEVPYGTDFGDLTMHNIEADPLTQNLEPTFDQGPRMFVSWYSLGMRALEYRPGHFHDNSNGEGSYSQNVHEVGRWIEEDGGSNFWGVHVDEMEVEGEATQVILASERNNGLYIFTFSCLTRVEVGDDEDPVDVLYCDPDTTNP
jgi:hypothetical protein